MKNKVCVLLLFLIISLCACTANSQPSPAPKQAQEANISVSPAQTPSPTLSPVCAKAYYNVVAEIIKKYGFYIDDSVYHGLLRIDITDLDNDGVPELICVYQKGGTVHDRQSVSIYRYKNDAAELLIDKQTGNGIWAGGEPCVEFANIDGKTYIITEDSVRGKTESLYIYTVENGKLKTSNISADFTLKKDEDYTVDHYFKCIIDGKSVSEEKYREQRDYYLKNALKWLYMDARKRSSYSKGYEAMCVKNLAKNAGISESEVSEFLLSTPTDAKASIITT